MVIAFGIDRGIVDQGEGQIGVRCLNRGQFRLGRFGRRQIGFAGGTEHGEGNNWLTIGHGEGGDFLRPAFDRGDLIQTHGASRRQAYWRAGQLIQCACRAQRANGKVGAAQLARPTAKVDVRLAQLVVHARRRQAQGQQAVGVKIDLDGTRGAADPRDLAHTAGRDQVAGDHIIDQGRQRLDRAAGVGHRIGQNRSAGHIHARDGRFVDAIGQVRARVRHRIFHIVQRPVAVDIKIEFDGQRCGAVKRRGRDVIDARDIRQRGFKGLHDLRGYLGRCRAGLRHCDADDWHVDIGKLGDRKAGKRHQTDQKQNKEQRNDRNRVSDGPGGHVHLPDSAAATGCTRSPAAKNPAARVTIMSPTSTPDTTSRMSPDTMPTTMSLRDSKPSCTAST